MEAILLPFAFGFVLNFLHENSNLESQFDFIECSLVRQFQDFDMFNLLKPVLLHCLSLAMTTYWTVSFCFVNFAACLICYFC